MYPSSRKSKMYTVPHSGDYSEPLEAQRMGGLTELPTNTPSNSHMSAFQEMNFMDQPDPRAFLIPGNYSIGRRGSTGADTVGSQYAWSSASNADILSRSPNMSSYDNPIGHGAMSPFMQGYYPSDSSDILNDPNFQGYTPQQIDKWCIDSNAAGDLYQSQPYPNMGSMQFSSPEMQTESYSTFNNGLNANEHWLPCPPHSSVDLIQESFFSPLQSLSAPRSVPAQTSHPYQSTPATISVASSPPHSTSDPDSPPPAAGGSSSGSGSNASDLRNYGIPTGDGNWRCAYPGCSSHASFRRGCDLRKHFNRHRKYLFCRYEGCPQSAQNALSSQNGFSSKKDRARHEAKHNPGVLCEWDGCGKVFSRVDNMKDHVRRIHRKGQTGRA
ncbi:hypothetical protein N7457_002944 [Penicillium paradoxum]|uniref:uncharacterized protein n=1 Tax=Penicillium paradoxum TaxID=176176 RepID=UPI002548A30A|nr:uncharacterized protein N7457_002944 [Penicillium paradoxum]KAJ5787954.1 hypothetical protein N7457_002944 [Penicillium paradoxum]